MPGSAIAAGMVTDTQLALIQLVALMIPAIGLYMFLYASHSTAERPLQTDTIYSAKLAALAFIGAAFLLVVIAVAGSASLSVLFSLVLSGVAVLLILVGFALFGESVWSISK